ncbi:tau 95 subunit of transcription factor TFIIIC [Cystobasidiomycetes sp. EMM_F5]
MRPDGTEVSRLINRTKYKGEMLISVSFDVLPENITLPVVCYTFSDGPFREACVRFGYDPRTDREARFYQRIHFRNLGNSKIYLKRIPGGNAGNTDDRDPESETVTHIFDGQAVHRNIGNYQLCDVSDEFLKSFIMSQDFVREKCEFQDGWWDSEFFETMRQMLRRKFFALLEDNIALPDDAMQDFVDHLNDYKAAKMAQTRLGSGESADQGNAEVNGDWMDRQEADFARPIKVTSIKHKNKTHKPKAKSVVSSFANPDLASVQAGTSAEGTIDMALGDAVAEELVDES